MNDKKYKRMADLIEQVLKEDLEARNSDNVLYADVLQKLNAPSRIVDAIRALNNKNLPSLESVTRIKRKIVEEQPKYRGKRDVTERRFELFKWYKENMKK